MAAIYKPRSSILHRSLGRMFTHRVPLAALLAALASLGTSAIHIAVAPEHFEEWWGYGLFFVVVALFQAFYGFGLLSPNVRILRERPYLVTGLFAHMMLIQFYVITRTVGIPLFGPHAGEAEAVGVLDLISKMLEVAAVLLIGRLLLRHESPKGALGAPMSLASVISVILFVSAYSTGHSHTHEHATLAQVPSSHAHASAGQHEHAYASATAPPSSHTTMHVSAKPGGDVALKNDPTRENVSPGPRCPSTARARVIGLRGRDGLAVCPALRSRW